MNAVAADRGAFGDRTRKTVKAFRSEIDQATKFIPLWVKAAGTMAANRSGLQWSTIRNLLMAWVLTLPVAILLSGSLYWLFADVF